MGCPQKEYLTRRGVARRRAYPSIFIRRRLHGYISRNVTITNAGTPSAETSSCFWGSAANPRGMSASLSRPYATAYIFRYSSHEREKQNATGEYVSRVCVSRVRSLDSFWPGHSAVTAALSPRPVKTFRPCADKSAI